MAKNETSCGTNNHQYSPAKIINNDGWADAIQNCSKCGKILKERVGKKEVGYYGGG